jgi:hypothetical protein
MLVSFILFVLGFLTMQPWFGLVWCCPYSKKQNSLDKYHYATNPHKKLFPSSHSNDEPSPQPKIQ